MRANKTLLHMKYARVICLFAKREHISIREAMDFFYHSNERRLIRDGVSDLHCMSDGYLSDDLSEEYHETYCRKNPIKSQCH